MIIQIGKKSEKSVKIRGSFRYIELTLISQIATFYQFPPSSSPFEARGNQISTNFGDYWYTDFQPLKK